MGFSLVCRMKGTRILSEASDSSQALDLELTPGNRRSCMAKTGSARKAPPGVRLRITFL